MITIHEKTARTFNTLGLGALLPSSCVVTEELNGAYELEMDHPYDADGKWKRIEEGRILYASTPRGRQPFRIYRIRPDMNGITVNARHIFYDLLDNQCNSISYSGTAVGALQAIQGAFAYAMPFTFTTDISASGTLSTGRMNPIQVLLSDDDDTTSFIKGFGGEVLRDGFNVSIKTSMGQDRDVAIRYGKNLIGLEVTQDESDVKTRIQCYGKNGSATVDSPYLGAYLYPKIHTLEDENKTVSELREEAQALLDSGVDIPLVNIKVDFIPLSKTVEYKNYAVLEDVQLGDIVTVIHNKMNFSKRARVISYEWDCILEQYNELELGDFMPTLASSVTSGVRSGNLASAAVVNASAVMAALQSHLGDYQNPHRVTAAQTGGSGGTTEEVQDILYGTTMPDDADGKDGDAYVKMRKEASGIDENTAFLLSDALADTSGNGVSITNNGVTISAAQSKFGGKSLYFDGSSYLEAALAVEGDVTIDCWVYFTEHGSQWCTPFNLAAGSNRGIYMHIMSTSIKLGASITGNDNADVEISEVLPFGAWHHIAIVRSGTNVYLFINGTKKGTMANSLTTNDKIVLGHLSSAASGTKYKGYMDELRVSKTARWTTDFTPPTEPYAKEAEGELYIKINGTWELAMKGVV